MLRLVIWPMGPSRVNFRAFSSRTNKKAKHGAIPTSASAKASVSGSAEKKANSRGAGTPGDFVFSMKGGATWKQ